MCGISTSALWIETKGPNNNARQTTTTSITMFMVDPVRMRAGRVWRDGGISNNAGTHLKGFGAAKIFLFIK